MDAIIERHAVVRHLIGNGWMHLFWLEPQGQRMAQCWQGQWLDVGSSAVAAS